MGNSDVRGRIDRAWDGWLDALGQAPEDRMTEPGVTGHWSVKDLMAHIAVWDDLDAEQVAAFGRGEVPDHVDWQAVNDKTSAERADWSLDRARDEMHAAHQRLLETYDQNIDKITISLEEHKSDLWEHYEEHAAEVRAWLGK